jgi:cytochrome P450
MDSAATWILVEGLVAAVVLLVLTRLLWGKKDHLPPGPSSLPIIGSLHHFKGKGSPHKSLAQLANKFGPLITVRFGQRLSVVASSPETAMEILKHQDEHFNRRPPLRATELLWPQDIAFNDVTPSTQLARKIFRLHVVSAKSLEESRHIRDNELSYMLNAIAKCNGGKVVMYNHIEVLMVNIISSLTFSKRLAGENKESTSSTIEEAKEFKFLTLSLSQCFGAINLRDILPFLKWLPDLQGLEPRMRHVRTRMESFLSKIIDEQLLLRQQNVEREKNMIDAFLDAHEGHKISNDLLKGSIWNIFAAGTETTTAAIEWIMVEVCRNPKIMQKAQAELDAVIGKAQRVQESDIPKLKYIQAIVKEGLRLHPPSPLLLPHYSSYPCKIFEYDIPTNTQVLINVWAIGRDPKIWSQPLEFIPERFLDEKCKVDFYGQHFDLLTFSTGRRICPGLGLAATVMHTVVANLLHAFSWRVADDIDMSEGVGVTVPMAVPFTAHVEMRLPSEAYQWFSSKSRRS